jgi:hypothetical protein
LSIIENFPKSKFIPSGSCEPSSSAWIDIAIMTSTRSGWDDRVLPFGANVIVAIHESHRLVRKEIVHWSDLGENILLPHYGPGVDFGFDVGLEGGPVRLAGVLYIRPP